MTEVKLTTALVGAVSYAAGDTFTCSEAEAKRLIAAGFAVPVAAPKMERAVSAPSLERRVSGKKAS